MRAFRENTVSLICLALKRELVVALNTQLAATDSVHNWKLISVLKESIFNRICSQPVSVYT